MRKNKLIFYTRGSQKQMLLIYYYICSLIGVLSNYKGPIKDTKRTRGRLDRNVATCNRPPTNVIGPLHECKKVCPCTKTLPQAGIRA